MTPVLQAIKSREARVVVIGAGYVGLPLAVETAKAGFRTIAYDRSREKVEQLSKGISYIKDVPTEVLAPLVKSGMLRASVDPDVLGEADVVIICVPTPLNKTKDPDISFIVDATDDDRAAHAPRAADRPREHHLPRVHARGAACRGSPRRALQGRRGLLPGLLARAGRSRQQEVLHPATRPKVHRRHHRRPASRWPRRSTAPSSTPWSRSRRPTRPRW